MRYFFCPRMVDFSNSGDFCAGPGGCVHPILPSRCLCAEMRDGHQRLSYAAVGRVRKVERLWTFVTAENLQDRNWKAYEACDSFAGPS